MLKVTKALGEQEEPQSAQTFPLSGHWVHVQSLLVVPWAYLVAKVICCEKCFSLPYEPYWKVPIYLLWKGGVTPLLFVGREQTAELVASDSYASGY